MSPLGEVVAADLPVKAKPVEYVQVCTLYGDGYYYIPGTDTCIKIGGYLRAEMDVNAGGTLTPGGRPGDRGQPGLRHGPRAAELPAVMHWSWCRAVMSKPTS